MVSAYKIPLCRVYESAVAVPRTSSVNSMINIVDDCSKSGRSSSRLTMRAAYDTFFPAHVYISQQCNTLGGYVNTTDAQQPIRSIISDTRTNSGMSLVPHPPISRARSNIVTINGLRKSSDGTSRSRSAQCAILHDPALSSVTSQETMSSNGQQNTRARLSSANRHALNSSADTYNTRPACI